MTAWFGPDVAIWFSFLSLLSILAVLEPLAQRGRHEVAVKTAFTAALLLGVVLLGLGALAALLGQPWHVVFALLLTGTVTTPVFTVGLHGVRRAYRAAEERRIVAKNI